MAEKIISCPKCGSTDLMDWGTDRRMCRNCQEVFLIQDARIIEPEPEEQPEAEEYPDYEESDASDYAARLREESKQSGMEIKESRYEVDSESEELDLELLAELEGEKKPESKEVSATQEYEKLHAEHQKKMKAEEAARKSEQEHYVSSTYQRSSYSSTSSSLPRQTQQVRKPTATAKKSTKTGCIIAVAIMFFVLMSLICSIVFK